MRFDAALATLAALALGANGASAQTGEAMLMPLCNGGFVAIQIPGRDGLPRRRNDCDKACHAWSGERKGRRGSCCP